MSAIISSIEELKKTVKINAQIPWESVEPFIQSARDIYLVRYLGDALLDRLEADEYDAETTDLLTLVQKALGPLAMWLGNAELSVRISDSGFTVAKQDGTTGYVPASDSKIAKVEESLERRGFQYLDKVLEYLETNAEDFPEWTASKYYTLRSANYIQSATQFQELGLVDIEYSRLTFESFRPLMSMIEQRFVTETITETLDTTLRAALTEQASAEESELIAAIRKFVACKTAEIHTSRATKQNRTNADKTEYKPRIRPLYADLANEGNFYAEQAAYYMGKIQQILLMYAVEFGVTLETTAPDFNNDDRHFFNMNG